VVIERYADRIELSNPGSLLVSREQLFRGSVSECRNKGLQLMF
jgi:ATP-dependent DNA helicase RecG